MKATTAGERQAVELLVLETIRGLLAELGTVPVRGVVALGDSLDRDLGIGSLERVELVTRLEAALGVRLGDAVITEAETCREVVTVWLMLSVWVQEPVPSVCWVVSVL